MTRDAVLRCGSDWQLSTRIYQFSLPAFLQAVPDERGAVHPLENQRATELAAAQTILHATELLVTSAQRRTVEIATSVSVWQGELKEVQEDETRNNLKMKEQSELVLAMRQSGPPGWHWQAPANKSTESGAAARDS